MLNIKRKIMHIIKKANKIALFMHVNPDGDAIGSSSAVYLALQNMKKYVDIYTNDKLGEKYKFLSTYNFYKDELTEDYDLLIALDTPTLERLGKFKDYFKQHNNTIVIDHHLVKEEYGKISYLKTGVASTCEVVYEIFKKNKIRITEDIATYLYLGLITDTGCFRYDRVTAKTLEIGADLIKLGAEYRLLVLKFFESKTKTQIEVYKEVYKNITFISDEIAYSYIDYEKKSKYNLRKEDLEGLPSVVVEIEGVMLAFLLTEMEKNKWDVSIRSSTNAESVNIALKHNGGGHKNASGCKMNGTFEEVVAILSADCIKEIERCKKMA